MPVTGPPAGRATICALRPGGFRCEVQRRRHGAAPRYGGTHGDDGFDPRGAGAMGDPAGGARRAGRRRRLHRGAGLAPGPAGRYRTPRQPQLVHARRGGGAVRGARPPRRRRAHGLRRDRPDYRHGLPGGLRAAVRDPAVPPVPGAVLPAAARDGGGGRAVSVIAAASGSIADSGARRSRQHARQTPRGYRRSDRDAPNDPAIEPDRNTPPTSSR